MAMHVEDTPATRQEGGRNICWFSEAHRSDRQSRIEAIA